MQIRPGRLAAAGLSILRANVGRLQRPLKINLCVTYWCQYRCKTCNIWRRKPTDELTTDELLTFVARNRGTQWLDVTGGEIFLRQDIDQILIAIVRQWRQLALLHFPTNGFLTDRIVSVVERLAAERAAPVVVTVSLDGDEALNDEIRGIRGGYQRQVATFNALNRIPGIRTVFGLTLSRHNAGKVEQAFEACRAVCPGLSIKDFHLNVAQRSAHYYGTEDSDDYSPSADQVDRDLDWYVRRRGAPRSVAALVESKYLRLLRKFVKTSRTPMPCHALRSSCFVDPWGTVFPCITFAQPVGNLRETGMDLAPIWEGAAATKLQREIWGGACPQCWTACEAYQSILGNAFAPWRTSIAPAGSRETVARRG